MLRFMGRSSTHILLPIFLLPGIFLSCSGEVKKEELSSVTIETEPEGGAVVVIQGEEKGTTPITITGVKPGSLDIVLKKEKYKRKAETLILKPGEHSHYKFTLELLQGYVSFETEPPGADVSLDGKIIGKTPIFKYPVPIGLRTYKIELANYYSVEGNLEVREDFQYPIKYILKPLEATLNVLSRPTGGSIRLNNVAQAQKTPAQFKLPPGEYLVSVIAPGFLEEHMKFELKPNEEKTITLVLKEGETPAGMVLVPAGEFLMGENERSPDEAPKRKVFVPAFYIDKYEVTNEEFKRVFPEHTFPKGQEKYPVRGISWDQANAYANRVGKRLPTEIEWEKAARGEDGREYPWGNEYSPTLANTVESKVGMPTPVGKYIGGVSPYGCFDMSGNVYEWTADWYQRYEGNTTIKKEYGQIYRVLRGGSFMTDKFDARCARRHFDRMDSKREDYGFRCVKDVPQVPEVN
ncbi:MAG: SUMF1/EgtB/PvdO family nonheme iron enzyme [Candidatus Hydrogenedentes bacterium]|nr:SUMF1/EgtB/PvdO family nonheme iron enzyme [Candidatus Hydrogenedentota bacterium]